VPLCPTGSPENINLETLQEADLSLGLRLVSRTTAFVIFCDSKMSIMENIRVLNSMSEIPFLYR